MIQPPINLYFPIDEARSEPPRTRAIAIPSVERGGWIAVGFFVLLLIVLRIPFHGRSLDEDGLVAINAWMSRLPLIGLQTAILNQDIAQLAIGMAAVAIWFRNAVDNRLRTRILIAFAAFFPTYAIARLAQHLGHRPRPIVDHALKILGDPVAFQQTKDALSRWGSFPSDHSALLIIATLTAFMVGRRAGIVALVLSAYSCTFRIAYGYHYPSDIAGGALLGALIFLIALLLRKQLRPVIDRLFRFGGAHPGIAAALGALVVIEFSDGFQYLKFFAALTLHQRLFH